MRRLLFLFLFFVLFSPAYALSCAPSTPKIGIVDSIAKPGVQPTSYPYYDINLTEAYFFSPDDVLLNSSRVDSPIINIDSYNMLVADYRGQRNVVETILTKGAAGKQVPPGAFVKRVEIPEDVLEQLELQKGDILITGPPFGGCSYFFFGRVKNGAIDRAFVRAYASFSFQGSTFTISPGKPLAPCPRQKYVRCAVSVDVNTGNAQTTLFPGQSMQIEGVPVTLHFLDASIEDPPVWGLDHYANFVLDFDDAFVAPPTPPVASEPQNPIMRAVAAIASFLLDLFGF